MSPKALRFSLGQGRKLCGSVFGKFSAAVPPVVFLHGGGQTRHSWDRVARRLPHAVALDMKGHGDSYWDAAGDYSISSFAEDLDRWTEVAVADFPRPLIVGASLGGLTALSSRAAKSRATCSGLVLVDIAPRMDDGEVTRILEFMRSTSDSGFASLAEAAAAIAAYSPQGSRAQPPGEASLRKNLREGEDGRWRWHWDPRFCRQGGDDGGVLFDGHSKEEEEWHARARDEFLANARAIPADVPVLLVRGQLSAMVSDEAIDEFRAAVPHAEFADVSGAAHLVGTDTGDLFADAVVGFAERVGVERVRSCL